MRGDEPVTEQKQQEKPAVTVTDVVGMAMTVAVVITVAAACMGIMAAYLDAHVAREVAVAAD